MLYFLLFFIGTIIGSALTAILARLPTQDSWLHGRSKCPHCHKNLTPIELIPVVSWALQGGRCRKCKVRLSVSYPLIEISTGVLFVLAYVVRSSFGIPLPLMIFRDFSAITVLLIIGIFDATHGLILDRVTVPGILVLGVCSILLGMSPLNLLLGMLIGGGFFLVQFFVSKGTWVGGGDIRLGILMGALLGPWLLLVALLFSYVFGALFGVVLLLTKKMTMKGRLPFGSFLAAGSLLVLFFGQTFVQWYKGFL